MKQLTTKKIGFFTKATAGVGILFISMLLAGPASALSFTPTSPVYDTTDLTATCASSGNYLSFYRPSGGLPSLTALCSYFDGTSPFATPLVGNFVIIERDDSTPVVFANATTDSHYVATLSGSYQVAADPTANDLSTAVGGSLNTSLLGSIGTFMVTNTPGVLGIAASLI